MSYVCSLSSTFRMSMRFTWSYKVISARNEVTFPHEVVTTMVVAQGWRMMDSTRAEAGRRRPTGLGGCPKS